jgi:glycosyltransferase involved in cell wall biosynthesis
MSELAAKLGLTSWRAALAAFVCFAAFVVLIRQYEAPWVLGALLGLVVLATLFIWPEITTYLIVAVLYANLPGLAVQYHGLPAPLAGSVALLFGIPLAHYLIVRREKLRTDRILALMLLFLLVQVLSSVFAKDLTVSAWSVGTYVGEGIILYALILNVVRDLPTLKRAIWSALLVGGLLGVLSIYQAVTHSYGQEFGGLAQRNLKFEMEEALLDGKVSKAGEEMRLSDRAFGPVRDPNIFAQILLILLPLAVFRMRDERSRVLRFAAAGLAGIILLTILLTYSRGAFVTLAGVLILASYLRYVRPRWVLAAALIVVISVPLLAPGYLRRVETILGAVGLVSKSASAQPDYVTRRRATEMLAALHVFLDHPVLGVGPGQYVPFYSVEYQTREDIGFQQINVPREAHNLYLQMAAETGFIGLAVFMTIVLLLLYRLFQARKFWARTNPEISNLAAAFALSILAYLGAGMFLHLSFERYFWFLLAMAGALLQISRAQRRAMETAAVGNGAAGLSARAAWTTRVPAGDSRPLRFPVLEPRVPVAWPGAESSPATRSLPAVPPPEKEPPVNETKKAKVAYIMSRFPKLTETFVLYEMTEVERLGTELEVYPLLKERQKVVHPEVQAFLPRTHFHPFFSWKILAAQWHYIRKDRARYLRLWSEVLRGTWGSANFFFGALGIFPKSVRFAYEMAASGVTHVHAHFATHPALAAFIIHRLTGIPFSFTAHAADIQVDRRMLDRKIEAASFVVAISEWNKELMARECGEAAREKIHVIHCGISPEVFDPELCEKESRRPPAFSCLEEYLQSGLWGGTPVRTGLDSGEGPRRLELISVGSLEEYKGHRYLISALRLLHELGLEFRCRIVGEGPLRRELTAHIARAGLRERVELLGGRPRPEVARRLAEADVMVLASVPTPSGKQEGIPVALMEAMASGLPVVSTAISGIPELIESGETGLLVPPADAFSLADAIEQLARNPDLRARLGEAGRRKVMREFNLRTNAAALRELILNSNRGGASRESSASEADVADSLLVGSGSEHSHRQ